MRLTAAAILTGLATQAAAGGLDITGQTSSFIFNPGTVVELGFSIQKPTITGNDAIGFGGGSTGNVGIDIHQPMASFKHDFTDKLSFGVIFEKPFGADIAYAATSAAMGGTTVGADTTSITALFRYKFTDRLSVYAGPRWQTASADFLLTGGLYAGLSGYTATMSRDQGLGYVVGAAFEIPEYFIRAALTYNSEIDHTFTTTEAGPLGSLTSQVSATTPQSVNFEFNAGVAPKTFVFGGARWVEWSKLQFAPPLLSGASPLPLVDFNDTTTYALGVGRQINDNWTGLFTLVYEPSTDRRTTPLTPSDGFFSASLGAVYTNDDLRVEAGLTHTWLGDATPFVAAAGGTVATFTDNSSLSIGMKIVKTF